MDVSAESLSVIDRAPSSRSFRAAVLVGLQKSQKEIPSKFLYDERGSTLFDEICETEEYYPTRTEMGIMNRFVDEIVDAVSPRARLVEYGSGRSQKTRILLDHVDDLAVYVPIDISRSHLVKSAKRIVEDYPGLPVQALCADYTTHFELPEPPRPAQKTVVFYPGSTIGNFQPTDARSFLERIANVVGTGGGLLIGVDLKKDPDVLRAAYNDAEGVTAAFNKNLLRRMNRELGATFDPDQFDHRAIWNEDEGCIEMHLRSAVRQFVSVAERRFEFEQGETIRTEYSYKYSLDGFADVASAAGFSVDCVWTDDQSYFSVQYCTVGE